MDELLKRIERLRELERHMTAAPWKHPAGTANYRVYGGDLRLVGCAPQVRHKSVLGAALTFEAEGRANRDGIIAFRNEALAIIDELLARGAEKPAT